jgi:hypothetical protein
MRALHTVYWRWQRNARHVSRYNPRILFAELKKAMKSLRRIVLALVASGLQVERVTA